MCAKNATPPPLALADSRPKLPSTNGQRNQIPRKTRTGMRTRNTSTSVSTRELGYRIEVGAEDGGDRAAGPERRNAPVRRRARQQRHERLDHRGDEAAGDVEAQVAHVAESVLDVLAERSPGTACCPGCDPSW